MHAALYGRERITDVIRSVLPSTARHDKRRIRHSSIALHAAGLRPPPGLATSTPWLTSTARSRTWSATAGPVTWWPSRALGITRSGTILASTPKVRRVAGHLDPPRHTRPIPLSPAHR
jgi:hypothetical protein